MAQSQTQYANHGPAKKLFYPIIVRYLDANGLDTQDKGDKVTVLVKVLPDNFYDMSIDQKLNFLLEEHYIFAKSYNDMKNEFKKFNEGDKSYFILNDVLLEEFKEIKGFFMIFRYFVIETASNTGSFIQINEKGYADYTGENLKDDFNYFWYICNKWLSEEQIELERDLNGELKEVEISEDLVWEKVKGFCKKFEEMKIKQGIKFPNDYTVAESSRRDEMNPSIN